MGVRVNQHKRKLKEVEKMMKLNASSHKGQHIMNRARNIDGHTLSDIYTRRSIAKEHAFDWCYNQFLKTENHAGFSICSHNSFGFTCSWFGEIDGEKILRYETKDNTYIVYLER